MRSKIQLLREFSIPLLAGVLVALLWANLDPSGYHHVVEEPVIGSLSLHFVINHIFMVLFFGIAAVEITQSCLPGGDMNPPSKAINPLIATAGGVVGPAGLYLLLNAVIGAPELARGWGIPTATDIAFAWLVARFVFGDGHPAISFLLLLAVADDAIGLLIIAIFYPNPHIPVQPVWLMLTAAGCGIAWWLRRRRVRSYLPYLLVGGGCSWAGLYGANLHPALALVPVIPFLPHPPAEKLHIFEQDPEDRTTLGKFEHDWRVVVDFGMFFFGLANAGVAFADVGPVTWLVVVSLLAGKTLGVSLFALVARAAGFPLPARMGWREVVVVGLIAGFGFTVALFVAGEAFTDPVIQRGAKMGALFSSGVALPAWIFARIFGVRKKQATSSE